MLEFKKKWHVSQCAVVKRAKFLWADRMGLKRVGTAGWAGWEMLCQPGFLARWEKVMYYVPYWIAVKIEFVVSVKSLHLMNSQ